MSNVIVLKCGGSIIDTLSERFFTNIRTLQKSGLKPIIVHGGGPAIQEMLDKQQIKSEFVDGLRKTTKPIMDVVEATLSGIINNGISQKLNDMDIQSVGVSGSDTKLLSAEAKNFQRYGYVGEVTDVNVANLKQLMDVGVVPVIAPIGLGKDGTRYNINADTAAGAVAQAMSAKQLVFVTDVPGIMQEDQLLETVREEKIHELIAKGTIYGGMIPKVEAAVASLSENLQEVMIVDGNRSVCSKETKLIGTVIKKSSVGVV